MVRQILVCVVLVVFTACLGSCAKLPDTGQHNKQYIKMEISDIGDFIPASWGKLISVSSASKYPMMVQLWFQDNDGNVYMIPYNIDLNTFNDKYRYLKLK